MTVSYVLNRRAGVSKETRERVTRALEQMGYAYNPHASRLSRGKGKRKNLTKNVGCILGESVNKYSDPYYGEIVETIERELIARGFHMIFVHSWSELKNDPILCASLLSRNIVDGLVVMGLPISAFELLQKNVDSIVAVDSECPATLDCIMSDHFEGGVIATRHLLELGHSRIAYISHRYEETGRDRLDGYISALHSAGITPDKDLILQADLSVNGGLATIQELLNSGIDFTAVFTHNDAIACGVIKGLHRANLKVPDDVSVIGYNNDFISELFEPEITTVGVAKKSLGQLAASEIIERIEGGAVPPRKQILPVQLITRKTSAPRKSSR